MLRGCIPFFRKFCMIQKKIYIAFWLSVPAVLLFLIFWAWSDGAGSHATTIRKPRREATGPLNIEGFSLTRHQSEILVFRLVAGRIKVAPRKFLIFNIRPFNEAIMEDVRIDLFRYPEKESAEAEEDLGLVDSLNSLDTGNLGLVTRGIVKDLEVRFHEGENLVHWLQADKVRIDLEDRELQMSDVRICDLIENREIVTRNAVWREGGGRIDIPGDLIIDTPSGERRAKGWAFNLETHVFEKL
jgi:hypothetical protein